jgi:hypothetical protein
VNQWLCCQSVSTFDPNPLQGGQKILCSSRWRLSNDLIDTDYQLLKQCEYSVTQRKVEEITHISNESTELKTRKATHYFECVHQGFGITSALKVSELQHLQTIPRSKRGLYNSILPERLPLHQISNSACVLRSPPEWPLPPHARCTKRMVHENLQRKEWITVSVNDTKSERCNCTELRREKFTSNVRGLSWQVSMGNHSGHLLSSERRAHALL